jgi:hypothetical protein
MLDSIRAYEDDRQAGEHTPLRVDPAQDKHRVDERGSEQPNGQLGPTVAEQGAHDARRELTHRELYQHQREGQRDADERNHGGCGHVEDRLGSVGVTGDALWDQCVIEVPIDRRRSER